MSRTRNQTMGENPEGLLLELEEEIQKAAEIAAWLYQLKPHEIPELAQLVRLQVFRLVVLRTAATEIKNMLATISKRQASNFQRSQTRRREEPLPEWMSTKPEAELPVFDDSALEEEDWRLLEDVDWGNQTSAARKRGKGQAWVSKRLKKIRQKVGW